MSSSIVSTATVSGETWCTPSEWKSREQKNSLHVPFDRLEVALSFTRDSVMFTSIVIRSNANANVACAFKFVVEAAGWFKSYFGGVFNEDAIHNNFVLIYEFLVEIMDFGYPPCNFKALHYSGRTVVPIFVGASYILRFNACWQDSYGRYMSSCTVNKHFLFPLRKKSITFTKACTKCNFTSYIFSFAVAGD